MKHTITLETIAAYCKRRGFVYPSADIYSGINGVYDFGPLGTLLRSNLKKAWMNHVSSFAEEVVFMDGALLGPAATWQASGHLENFSDPMIDCTHCKKRYRADDGSMDPEKPCPSCGVQAWTPARKFNLMFETKLGAMEGTGNTAYLRPETAQSIFINFKNVLSSNRLKLPFGIAQVGKSFRNEITPKQFLFRVREFEQMEIEFFCKPEASDDYFSVWLERQKAFYQSLGFTPERLRLRPHDADELSHYSKCCTDVEYFFPFGWKELEGIAHRGNYDLSRHSQFSGKDLSVFDEATQTSFIPHVVECSVGVDRLFFALLCDAYQEETLENGESRVVLRLPVPIAPITAAVLPLTKKQSELARPLFLALKKAGFSVMYDESASIGKRYRRQDEIGTPFCITIDYDSANDQCVTIRNRDTLSQERLSFEKVIPYLKEKYERE